MTPEDISSYVNNLRARKSEIECSLADPAVFGKPAELRGLSQELRKLEHLFDRFDEWVKDLHDIADNRELMASESDAELRELAEADIATLEKRAAELEGAIQISLLPPEPNDSKNIIVEIKPAAGGDEAALFAGEMFRAYLHFAEKEGWKVEILDSSETDLGGVKDVSFSLSGEDVYSLMKYESGVHRVQRVPETEAGGRIHTSTITVAVMPEAEEVELNIRPEDLRFDVFRSSGPGGQCVNTTDSAVRVTHIPTGMSVASQQEKSQHRNKEIALRILYARLLEIEQRAEADKLAADKRSQVGTGDRSERIRTYNFPQNRVTDHRFNVSSFDLPKIMEGDMRLILDQILMIVCERRLDQLRQG
ncbi:MAG: peptide chain release factor 1 [Victivallaceae bacterium]|nr:peptide chain release factor 1 [Victivallaceae bacterium]